MGRQSTPRAIAELAEGSLTRSDAEELYAETPKRVLFDALWGSVSVDGAEPGKKTKPYDIIVALTELLRWQR